MFKLLFFLYKSLDYSFSRNAFLNFIAQLGKGFLLGFILLVKPLEDEEAIRSAEVSAGPTQGVQPKLKVKPMMRAAMGPGEKRPASRGRRSSRLRKEESPNIPS
jgi:hypothetical protein